MPLDFEIVSSNSCNNMDCIYRGWANGRGEGEVGVGKPSIETQRTVLRIQYVALTDTKNGH